MCYLALLSLDTFKPTVLSDDVRVCRDWGSCGRLDLYTSQSVRTEFFTDDNSPSPGVHWQIAAVSSTTSTS